MIFIYLSGLLLAALLFTPSESRYYPNSNDGRAPFRPQVNTWKSATQATSLPIKTWKLPAPQIVDSRTVASSSSFDLNSLINKLPKDHLIVVVDAMIKNLHLNAASNEKEIAALSQKLDRLTAIVEAMRNSLPRPYGNIPPSDGDFWTKRL